MFYDCGTDDSLCTGTVGEECCDAAQCDETCARPCNNQGDCPESFLGCEHGYCLFRCDDDDADCAAFPGYTCQHSGTLCEND